MGCEAARGEILVFVSGHCIPENKEWLRHLLAPFSDPEVAITYGRQIGGEETKFSEHRIFAKYFPDTEEPSQGEIFCNNANAALRRDDWAAQPFDEKLTGLEDMAMAKVLARKLEKELGCEVIMTRTGDTFLELEERTAIANKVGADLFISRQTCQVSSLM